MGLACRNPRPRAAHRAGFLAGIICAVFCTRFRDLPQIVQNLLQIMFFVSPVTWRADLLPEDAMWIIYLNPFAAFLHIVSEPLLGRIPSGFTYFFVAAITVALAAIAWPLFVRFRTRIVYWL